MEIRERHQKATSQASRGSGTGRVIRENDLLATALKLLSIRPRSVSEISVSLAKKSSDSEMVNRVIEKLKKDHFLDDEKFALWLVESRSRTKPRGKRLLARELKAKGVDIIPGILDTDEKSLAGTALTKKHRLWKNLSYRDYRVKAGRFLASRGFSWDVIEDTVKRMYNSTDVS